jgi:hypothetical protein
MLLQGLPNAGRAILEGCGHVPGYSHPERFAQVVAHFLTPPPTPRASEMCPMPS